METSKKSAAGFVLKAPGSLRRSTLQCRAPSLAPAAGSPGAREAQPVLAIQCLSPSASCSVKHISCSLLILHAEDDPVVPFQLGRKVGVGQTRVQARQVWKRVPLRAGPLVREKAVEVGGSQLSRVLLPLG